MSNLREGGLAIIIGGNQETIGLVVTTVRAVSPGGLIVTPSGKRFSNGGSFRWLIHSDQLFVKLSDGTIIDDYCLCFEHHLMPIDGEDFSHEDEHQKEREHA
ncbi:hypothetical protein HUK76_19625 [Citrobacter portucalensis]|uniref:hypothetical protein n=1 Tax=Citrobacter portucalensis TaxID=1639133 RepID=UPI0015804A9B|nr:hypothetical protein [Citrobacter portucalensis]NUH55868.1 hypothetical protein [Citrobacter portucalensis]